MPEETRHTVRSKSQVSEIMSRIGSRNTGPERIFRKALRRLGLRSFKTCDTNLPGKPDIVLSGKKMAVFIDGDFWHGNQPRMRGFESLQGQLSGIHNREYWESKISRNMARDFQNTAELLHSGWRVLRFWESDIRKDPERWAGIVVREYRKREAAAYAELPARTVVEMFAGIGLVRLALEPGGWKTVFGNDNDPQKFAMYRENFGADGFDKRSIHDLVSEDIPSCALVTASFPCNDLSVAGARNGLNGVQSSTFWGLVRLLEGMGRRRPPLVLLENVPGFLASHGGEDFESALLALNSLGYSCDAFLIDAVWFVPQSRLRVFVVAKQVPPCPEPKVITTNLRPSALVKFIRGHSNIGWDIRPLPEIQPKRVALPSVLEDLAQDDPRWWPRERAEYFINQLSLRHRRTAEFMISQREMSYGTAFRRIRHGKSMAELRVDGIAGCLRTPRGGSGRQILFKAGRGKYQVRLLTPRECARLQGVPDESFRITVRDNYAFFGFGDAVCVPVIHWIAENYLNPEASELIRGRVLARSRQ